MYEGRKAGTEPTTRTTADLVGAIMTVRLSVTVIRQEDALIARVTLVLVHSTLRAGRRCA